MQFNIWTTLAVIVAFGAAAYMFMGPAGGACVT